MAKRSRADIRQQAQNEIIDAILASALHNEHDPDLVTEIKKIGTRLCKQWNIYDKPGLPDTFQLPY